MGINPHDLSCHYYAATRARHAGCRSAIYEGRERFHAKTAQPNYFSSPHNYTLWSGVLADTFLPGSGNINGENGSRLLQRNAITETFAVSACPYLCCYRFIVEPFWPSPTDNR
jgi:hypothetical protein